jgi:DNA-binding transcriptional regulator YhcF (GntR family)
MKPTSKIPDGESPGQYLPRDSVDSRWGDGTRAGFTPLPNALIHAQARLKLSANDFVVLVNLISHWWYRKRVAFPSTATIAKRTGLGLRTVQRSISNLEELGLIASVSRREGGVGYEFEGLIAVTEQHALEHEWRSGLAEQRLPNVILSETQEPTKLEQAERPISSVRGLF